MIWTMFLSGGLAGLVACNEIFGYYGKFKVGMPEFGFTGIAVALLARCHPLGVIVTSMLFGALHQGAMGLEMNMDFVTSEVSSLLQGLVVLAVTAEGIWPFFIDAVRRRRFTR